jgi:hypothetical protein
MTDAVQSLLSARSMDRVRFRFRTTQKRWFEARSGLWSGSVAVLPLGVFVAEDEFCRIEGQSRYSQRDGREVVRVHICVDVDVMKLWFCRVWHPESGDASAEQEEIWDLEPGLAEILKLRSRRAA